MRYQRNQQRSSVFGRALFTALILPLLLCGCFSDSKDAGIPTYNGREYSMRIGFSMATLLEDRWLQDRDIFIAKAQQKNIDVVIQNANRDSNLQLEQVRDMLERGIDVLVVVPNDSNLSAQCVQAAKEKGVPVVMYDRLIYNSGGDVYISFDNNKVGHLMAEYLLEKVPTGGYMLVNGPLSDHNSTMIREGYMEVLQPVIDSGRIEILVETWTDGWVREIAYDFVSSNLPEYAGRTGAVICGNDSLAWGVTDALSEARILQQVEVVGMDADLTACQRIAKDMQGMTVYKPIHLLVDETILICEKLAAGESISTDRTINDGTYEVPFVAIDVVKVTKETLDETVIQDGFHLREDVYTDVNVE